MRPALLVPLLVALVGCAQPVPAPSQQLDPELGVQPTVTEAEPMPLASPDTPSPSPAVVATPAQKSSPAAPGDGVDSDSSSPAGDPSPIPTTPSRAPSPDGGGESSTPEPVVLLAVGDRADDHGVQGPDWTDLRSLELVEVGNDLRVTLRFGDDLPSAPPEGEVPLVGVDIGDEGYQLFVEGGGESWAAYLDTPHGFVKYPGTFELAGSAMVLQLPFSAVGSPTRAPVWVFVEWSRDSGTLGVLNPTSEDHLDGEPHTFDRAP